MTALERAMAWMRAVATERNHPLHTELWLIWREVARLEQERDEALDFRDHHETMKFHALDERDSWRRLCDEARSALAAARAREQRLLGILDEIDEVAGRNAAVEYRLRDVRALARAALAGQPAAGPNDAEVAAAFLAATEPLPCESGSASAAADEPRCPGCGWRVADCNCVARAAADEPGEQA